MRKAILCGLVLVCMSLGCTVVEAGVIRTGYKVTKGTMKTSAKVVKKSVKVAYKVAY